MTTLIQVSNSDGIVGRCDAKCYNAEQEKCTCVCGGKNHGAGRVKATANTEAYTREILELHKDTVEFFPGPAKQLSLFAI